MRQAPSSYRTSIRWESLGPHEVEVKITHCGVCYSDIHLIDNDWGMSKYPFIPGHEIVGTVTGVGSEVTDRKLGERVGIGWQADSCGICEWCRQGDEHLCAKAQPTCIGRNGGYADAIRVNCEVCDSGAGGAGERERGSAAVRRDYGV